MNYIEKIFKQCTVDNICAVLFLPVDTEIDKQTKEQYILIYLYDALFSKTKCWFCVKKEAIPERGKVVFKVPDLMMGRVIGRNGMNIKKIAKEIGSRYVNVQKV